MFRDLVEKNRSVRRFDPSMPVTMETLRELVDLARLTPSAANLQPLKYLLSADETRNARIFECLGWAGALADWSGPGPGERPTAYVVVLSDREVATNVGCDHGIAAQTILLGAVEKGLNGCMLGSVDRDRLRRNLALSDRYAVLLVLALGKAAETVRLEAMEGQNVKYWRDAAGVHHVPKRSLDEVLVG